MNANGFLADSLSTPDGANALALRTSRCQRCTRGCGAGCVSKYWRELFCRLSEGVPLGGCEMGWDATNALRVSAHSASPPSFGKLFVSFPLPFSPLPLTRVRTRRALPSVSTDSRVGWWHLPGGWPHHWQRAHGRGSRKPATGAYGPRLAACLR